MTKTLNVSKTMTEREFERTREELHIFQPGEVIETTQDTGSLFGFTPDGGGFYWYGSLEELRAEHA